MPEEVKQDGQVEEVQEEQPQMEDTQEELSNSEQPEQEDPKEGELPEGVKERTRKEFEKLKKSNAELKAQLDQRKNLPSVLDFLSSPQQGVPSEVKQQYMQPVQLTPVYPQMTPPAPQKEEQRLVDEQGYVNADVLQRELDEAKRARQKAEEAERRALEIEQRVSRFEIDRETQELYKAYPELDPQSEHFNQDAYELVRNDLTSQLITSGTRDALKSAQKMSRFFRAQPQQQSKTQEVLEQRKQASVSGTMPRQVDSRPISQLSSAERLKRWEESQGF